MTVAGIPPCAEIYISIDVTDVLEIVFFQITASIQAQFWERHFQHFD